MTAEEFVVEELKRTREDALQAYRTIDHLKDDINEVQEKYETLYKFVDSIMSINDDRCGFNSIWEDYDKEQFDYLKNTFPQRFFNDESEDESND